jgi:hypothetical protein
MIYELLFIDYKTHNKQSSELNMKNMRKTFTVLLLMAVCASLAYAQPKAYIFVQKVTPWDLAHTSALTSDSSITSGDRNFAVGSYVYFNVKNTGDATTITSATWTLLSKPTGSNATISSITGLNWWAKIKSDSTGTYNVKVTMVTSSGSKDTTINVYSASYCGTGGFYGIAAVYPNCMSCHQYMPAFSDIFNRWKVSGHANWFRLGIDSLTGYGQNCFPCHTTGYKRNLVTPNDNGFDNVASRLGWTWYPPSGPGKFDSIVTRYPGLVPFASIGCENCHGPGSEHVASGGDTVKITINYKADVCGQCHDSPQHHPNYTQWKNAKHANTVWNSGFAQQPSSPDFGTNDLGNCIRCHDALGYVNFTKGRGTDTRALNLGSQNMISCQTCHDQHGNSNDRWLRNRPAGSDTLATGFHYSIGKGNTCADCHKARKNNVTFVQTRVTSSTWGPHHGPQTDVLLGKNAATFPGYPPYISGSHGIANSDACIDCHMAPIDTNANIINKVGGHSFNMRNDSLNYDFVAPCKNCHGNINTHFSDLMAPQDYDSSGTIQSWQQEIAGCIHNLAQALPHIGTSDTVNWSAIAADSNNVTKRKAYWNYLLLTEDKSQGFHNPFFYVTVAITSRLALLYTPIGIQPINTEIPFKFELAQNYPNPFNPTTKFTFSLPKNQQVTIKIYDLLGREVKTLVDKFVNAGKYSVTWDGDNISGNMVASGVYFYRIETPLFTDVKKMVLVR